MDTIFTVVSSKGQIVIPAPLREKLGIKTGTRVAIQHQDSHLLLQPITDEFIDSLMGCCKGNGSLLELRDREHALEK